MIDRLIAYLIRLVDSRRKRKAGDERQRQQIADSAAHVQEATGRKVATAKVENIIAAETAKYEIDERKRDVDALRRTLEELVARVNRDPVHKPRPG